MGAKTTYTTMAELIVKYRAVRVLDAGCGDGRLGLALRRLKWRGDYFGVDRDEESLDVLKSRKLKGEVVDLRWLDYRHYTEDCVVVKDVILSNETLCKLLKLTRRLFIVGFIPGVHWYPGDLMSVTEQHSFTPQWKDSHTGTDYSLIVFERKKKP